MFCMITMNAFRPFWSRKRTLELWCSWVLADSTIRYISHHSVHVLYSYFPRYLTVALVVCVSGSEFSRAEVSGCQWARSGVLVPWSSSTRRSKPHLQSLFHAPEQPVNGRHPGGRHGARRGQQRARATLSGCCSRRRKPQHSLGGLSGNCTVDSAAYWCL